MTPTNRGATRIITRMELHNQLDANVGVVSAGGRQLEGLDKLKIINDYNQAVFMRRYDSPPLPAVEPIVIDTKQGTAGLKLSLYVYSGHVDVLKQRKKRYVAFRLWYSDQRNSGNQVPKG